MVAKDEIYDQESPQYDQTGAENEPEVHGVENIGDEDVISSDPEVEVVFGLMDVTARNVLHFASCKACSLGTSHHIKGCTMEKYRFRLMKARWGNVFDRYFLVVAHGISDDMIPGTMAKWQRKSRALRKAKYEADKAAKKLAKRQAKSSGSAALPVQPPAVISPIRGSAKRDVAGSATGNTLEHLKSEIKAEVKAQMTQEIKAEMRAQIVKEVREELRQAQAPKVGLRVYG